ncbi:hypothetical protein ELQ39_27885 [Streptomyces sp. GB4-14]|uniref:hypothetical protein n=1 Tax=Streptomyces sp. GB4-14 TaxID=2498703 RepID=UPI001F5EE9F2|nr:hypothetical protein [Streptomyces sp. GB4-14]
MTARIAPAPGDRLKEQGMADADQATSGDWKAECDDAIAEMARRRIPFQASDLVREGLVTEPTNHHQWGPRFAYAARRGVIREVAATKSRRTASRSSRLVTWIGAA